MSDEHERWGASDLAEQAPRLDKWPRGVICGLSALFALLVAAGALIATSRREESRRPTRNSRNYVVANQSRPPSSAPSIKLWWGDIPAEVRQAAAQHAGARQDIHQPSNIHPEDYVGADACKQCHPKNHSKWSQHSHRWMNALADSTTVKGDFTGASIRYLGGEATFLQQGDRYLFRLTREVTRTYIVNQTIGSRFFQYYIGKQISGPEPSTNEIYLEDHVLPFGYWLEQAEWAPVVHIFKELPDGQRFDPFDFDSYSGDFASYAYSCNVCHTTFALGDLLCSNTKHIAREVPVNLHWSATSYLAEVRPELLRGRPDAYGEDQLLELLDAMDLMEAPTDAVSLGVSCEACHLGGREHALDPTKPPRFFPQSPHLLSEKHVEPGRNHDNLNWACGRCHTGGRPQFAGGMSTWNSTEYSDAMRGSCYSELRCVDCHNPHETIGPKWPLTSQQDDALCIRCHQQYETPQAKAAHSHHPADSEGSRCMNCHMPRLNEGMQDVVRTHMIFSPTNRAMIHDNNPNACNQCHTDKSIDWTLGFLQKWFDVEFDDKRLDLAYPNRDQPAAMGWLKSEQEAVRLVAADSLFRTMSHWALDDLIDALDDPFLLNRQFARRGLETMLNVKLEEHGYRYYMTPEERAKPIAELRKVLHRRSQERSSSESSERQVDQQ